MCELCTCICYLYIQCLNFVWVVCRLTVNQTCMLMTVFAICSKLRMS